jgi:hypothetical protein
MNTKMPATNGRRTTMNRHLLLFALLGVAALAHAERVYKWTDAQGITHYSDAPPPQDTQNVQTVRVSGGDRPHADQAADAAAAAPDASKPAAPAAAQPAPEVTNDPAEYRAKNCAAARSNLEILQSKFPVSMPNKDGKQEAVADDKSRQAAIADARAQIAEFCK